MRKVRSQKDQVSSDAFASVLVETWSVVFRVQLFLKEISPVGQMDNALHMLLTLHCLSREQEYLAQVEVSRLQVSKPKLPNMTGRLLGSGMARLWHQFWDT